MSLKTSEHQKFCFLFISDYIDSNYLCEFRKSLLKKTSLYIYIRENVLNSLVFSDITK